MDPKAINYWDCDAVLSPCGRYRPWLRRRSLIGPRRAVWIMLNPSTADHTVDDPTIRRCRSYSEREGCGTFAVINLFTARATKPQDLARMDDPVGPQADEMLEFAFGSKADLYICGWGRPREDAGSFLRSVARPRPCRRQGGERNRAMVSRQDQGRGPEASIVPGQRYAPGVLRGGVVAVKIWWRPRYWRRWTLTRVRPGILPRHLRALHCGPFEIRWMWG